MISISAALALTGALFAFVAIGGVALMDYREAKGHLLTPAAAVIAFLLLVASIWTEALT